MAGRREHAEHLHDLVGVYKPDICIDCRKILEKDPTAKALKALEERVANLEKENRTRRLGGW